MLSPMSLGATIVAVVATSAVGYLVGSVPVANLVAARRADLDLRTVGDRNPGYWNAKETLGRRRAVPVFVGDVAKGAAGAGLGIVLAGDGQWWMAYIGAGAAMVGHAFPVFAGFRGGRSVLAFVGGALVFTPVAALIAVGVLILAMIGTRSFAVGARAGIVALPFVQIVVDGPYRTAATGALMTFIGLRFVQAAMVSRTHGPATSDDG